MLLPFDHTCCLDKSEVETCLHFPVSENLSRRLRSESFFLSPLLPTVQFDVAHQHPSMSMLHDEQAISKLSCSNCASPVQPEPDRSISRELRLNSSRHTHRLSGTLDVTPFLNGSDFTLLADTSLTHSFHTPQSPMSVHATCLHLVRRT